MTTPPEYAVDWDKARNCVTVLDQTKLPQVVELRDLLTVADVFEAIKSLQVRGAPSIGICGAMGLASWAAHNAIKYDAWQDFKEALERTREYINSSRPTAVNLSWALQRLFDVAMQDISAKDRASDWQASVVNALISEALKIRDENVEECRAIGEWGLSLCKEGDTMMTICNTGGLATAKYGTALAILLLGQERGMRFKTYALETRPLLQGSRLTTWELMNKNADVTLITDSMAAAVMRSQKVDRVIVGADRVALNGDTANKIGTYSLAVLARFHGIPFYVAAPLSSFDFTIASGAGIVIEERPGSEVTGFGTSQAAPTGCPVYNPAFDVTPHHLISGYITEKGILVASQLHEHRPTKKLAD